MALTKTTIEIDETKLGRLMKLTGLRTRKEVVDYALTEAERLAVLASIRKNPLEPMVLRESVDENYDLNAMRRMEVRYGSAG